MRKRIAAVSLLAAVVCLSLVPNAAAEAEEGRTLRADTVVTSRLDIVDKEGRTRAFLDVDENGIAMFVISGVKGNLAFTATASESGDPEIVLYDAKGQERIGFNVLKGKPNLVMLDGQGKPRVNLTIHDSGNTVFRLNDPSGRGRIVLANAPNGMGLITAVDEKGNFRFIEPQPKSQ